MLQKISGRWPPECGRFAPQAWPLPPVICILLLTSCPYSIYLNMASVHLDAAYSVLLEIIIIQCIRLYGRYMTLALFKLRLNLSLYIHLEFQNRYSYVLSVLQLYIEKCFDFQSNNTVSNHTLDFDHRT